MRKYLLTVTTIADGSGSASINVPIDLLFAVVYDKGTFATGVDVTLAAGMTPRSTAISRNLIVITNGDASAVYYPRADSHDASGAATVGSRDVMPLVGGTLTMSVAAGGDAKTGALVVYLMDIEG